MTKVLVTLPRAHFSVRRRRRHYKGAKHMLNEAETLDDVLNVICLALVLGPDDTDWQ